MAKRYAQKQVAVYARRVKKSVKPAKRVKPRRVIKVKSRIEAARPKPLPAEAPPAPEAQPTVKAQPAVKAPPAIKTPPAQEPPADKPAVEQEDAVTSSAISHSERKKAMLVPVPDSGKIPTPYIEWSKIPKSCVVDEVIYLDYPTKQAPKGMLSELREMFRRNRIYQSRAPVNVLIWGPKGTGKSELLKKFAETTGLPYWQVMGQEGLRADELLGHWELKGGTSRWVDGIIPKAVRYGGILHFDEANVIEPAVLSRLDELLDSKRQLNMEDMNGEIIKAHPDLFIVFTMNPPIYEGLKSLPEHIMSRLTKKYWHDYPPMDVEMKLLKEKLKLTDAEFKPPTKTEQASGTFAPEILDLLKIISNLRKQTDLSYTPSLRETQSFIQDLKEGDDFFTAFDRNIKAAYYGEEADRIEEALRAVRGRS